MSCFGHRLELGLVLLAAGLVTSRGVADSPPVQQVPPRPPTTAAPAVTADSPEFKLQRFWVHSPFQKPWYDRFEGFAVLRRGEDGKDVQVWRNLEHWRGILNAPPPTGCVAPTPDGGLLVILTQPYWFTASTKTLLYKVNWETDPLQPLPVYSQKTKTVANETSPPKPFLIAELPHPKGRADNNFNYNPEIKVTRLTSTGVVISYLPEPDSPINEEKWITGPYYYSLNFRDTKWVLLPPDLKAEAERREAWNRDQPMRTYRLYRTEYHKTREQATNFMRNLLHDMNWQPRDEAWDKVDFPVKPTSTPRDIGSSVAGEIVP